jgi:hypothetical protein
MKIVVNVALVVAGISLILGIIARINFNTIGPIGLEAPAFLKFTNTCLLIAITGILLQLKK